jgi:hypothetical protein
MLPYTRMCYEHYLPNLPWNDLNDIVFFGLLIMRGLMDEVDP